MSPSKPAYTHSIVNVKAGEVIPETFLAKLCSEYKSFVGLVVREPTKIEVEKFFEFPSDEARTEMIRRINTSTQKFPRQFVFGAFPTEFDEDEGQPWIVIKDSKGNPILTVACEGDFAGRTSNEGYSEAFVLLMEYLGPKLEDVYKLSSNNPTKLFEYINSDSFKADLKNCYSFRGAFGFMPSVGEPILLGNFRDEGKGGADYSWGTASFNHGYTDPVIESATVEPPVQKPKPKAASKYDTEIPQAPEAPKEPVPSVPRVVPPTPKDPVGKVAEKIVEESATKWSPPASVRGKGLKKAYRDMLGYLPENWQQRPSFMLKAKDAPEVKVEKPKDMTQDAPRVVLPVIDGNQQAKAVDFIKKHLGDGSLEIEDNPLEAQKKEANLAVFSELCLKGNNLDEINRWPVSGIFAFVKQNPEVAALLIVQLRRDRINRMATIKEGDKTMGELAGTVTAPADTPPKTPLPTETQPAMPEPRRAAGGKSRYD